MRRLILVFISFSLSFGISIKELNNLSQQQFNIMLWVYKQGKQYNLEYTLMAIAWEESKFGKFKINLSDPSCGIFHNLLGSVANRLNLKPNSWNQSRICERLVEDNTFALNQAILELKLWDNYWKIRGYKNTWRKMVSSYNGGTRGNKQNLQRIIERIKILRKYFKHLENNPTFK